MKAWPIFLILCLFLTTGELGNNTANLTQSNVNSEFAGTITSLTSTMESAMSLMQVAFFLIPMTVMLYFLSSMVGVIDGGRGRSPSALRNTPRTQTQERSSESRLREAATADRQRKELKELDMLELPETKESPKKEVTEKPKQAEPTPRSRWESLE